MGRQAEAPTEEYGEFRLCGRVDQVEIKETTRGKQFAIVHLLIATCYEAEGKSYPKESRVEFTTWHTRTAQELEPGDEIKCKGRVESRESKGRDGQARWWLCLTAEEIQTITKAPRKAPPRDDDARPARKSRWDDSARPAAQQQQQAEDMDDTTDDLMDVPF